MLVIILFLFFLLLLLGAALTFTNRTILRQNIFEMLILFAVSVAFMPSLNGRPFMGLEYEDAYMFAANSHYLLFNQEFSVDPLETHACAFGSSSDCKTEVIFGGHFITVPSLAYFTHKLVGYHPYAVCWINYVASVISAFLLYFLCLNLVRDRACSLLAALVYALCPAIFLFHSSGLAETTSSFFLVIYVFCFISLFINKKSYPEIISWLLWGLLGISLCLALLTKRENLVLLALPLFALPATSLRWSREVRNLTLWAGITIPLAIVLTIGFKIFQIETGESGDIGAPTFSVQYSAILIPLFCRAFLTFKWFGISTLILLCGIAAMLRPSVRRSGWPVVLGLFFAYLIVYTSHYRSYYFVKYGSVTEFGSLRYITNFLPFFAALTALGLNEIQVLAKDIGGRWDGCGKLVVNGIAAVWVLSSVGMIHSLHTEWGDEEWDNRISPVLNTLQKVSPREDYILTNLSVIFQVFAGSNVRIVDSYSVGTALPVDSLIKDLKTAHTIWWLRPNDADVEDTKRYPEFYQFVQQYEVTECASGFGPYSLCHLIVR
ncbi:MAG: hypothetical protein E7813_10360 [Bradyrhizobium sp.]|uniref:ArnT family glycosyltransferase n=1 Tax=Bradyrhizobium sp. TaxID=376 RepID=UPI0011FA4D96|nr:hypothetical protein [Bradyrhizobium sp.]THD68424.1 MAG: hypothetical protein E7813_10360 [Bradyrhizobium sp.]